MTQGPIENPVINSPYLEPQQHFVTGADGTVTGEIEPRRRPSEFFVPVAQPKKRSGPLTVESLSPHRVMITGPEDAAAAEMTPSVDAGAFVTSILDNLRRAGVQNTKRNERLEFARLDPYPGVWVQGVGEYAENGQSKTVVIAIGPGIQDLVDKRHAIAHGDPTAEATKADLLRYVAVVDTFATRADGLLSRHLARTLHTPSWGPDITYLIGSDGGPFEGRTGPGGVRIR